ncbi:hypothetical protein [Saccharothrix hoggarensis]|uniref:Uncharacterized protein n=1 Tax=Saccharothrix hoggarensis TaxID=913853 RepID=A0ABW3QMM8_9PSEU
MNLSDLVVAVGLTSCLLCLAFDLLVFQPWRHRENWQDGVGFWLLILLTCLSAFWALLGAAKWLPNVAFPTVVVHGLLAALATLCALLAVLMAGPAIRQSRHDRGKHRRREPAEGQAGASGAGSPRGTGSPGELDAQGAIS